MNHTLSARLVRFFLNRADGVLPAKDKEWAQAMWNEMPAVAAEDHVAWATGCWSASLVRRLSSPNLNAGRILVSLVLLILIASDLFATVLTAAYRFRFLRLADGLGRMTPGDDYHRLIPLMDGLPLWLHGMMIVAAGCYALAILGTIYRCRTAFLAVFFAAALELFAGFLSRPIIENIGVVANPNPALLARIVPVLVPLIIATLLWSRDARVSQKCDG